MNKFQSANHILMIEPYEFYSNKETHSSNHYQTQSQESLSIDEITKSAIAEFNYLKNKPVYAFLFNLNPSDKNKFKSIEKPINMTTEKHLGYAIQWFGLFAILFIMTLVIGLRKDEK